MIVLEKFNQIDKFGMVANFFIKFSDFVGSYKLQFFGIFNRYSVCIICFNFNQTEISTKSWQ